MAYPCDQCDATYHVRMSMLNHKRLKHGDAKQFNCEHCVYTTTKKDHLQQHVRSQHEKVKEICETCGKNFTDKPTLNRHVRQFHPENKEQIKRKPTENLETPTKRIKIAQPENNDDGDGDERGNGEGNEKTHEFKCSICDKQFKELKNLNKHIKNVHEEKSLKCNDCSYTTNNAPNMQRHAESCKKRRREEDVDEQDAKRAREEEVHSYNEAPIEDVPSDDTETCFGGKLQTKIWKHRGCNDILKEMENYKEKFTKSA